MIKEFEIITDIVLSALKNDELRAKEKIEELENLSLTSREKRKSISTKVQLDVFKRDNFTCRYCGKKLIFVPVLRALSIYFPNEFKFHSAWKMGMCHLSYWKNSASCDHLLPIARGGLTTKENLITACYMCNSIKQNWTLEDLRWQLRPISLEKWDGLCSYLEPLLELNVVKKKLTKKDYSYFKPWTGLIR